MKKIKAKEQFQKSNKSSDTFTQIKRDISKLGNPQRAEHSKRFFKTGPGQYGENDLFYGGSVPEMRLIAKKYKDIDQNIIVKLLHDRYHECRLIALMILVERYKIAEKIRDEKKKEDIFKFYLANTRYINNWDLVDLSAPKIVGAYLFDKKRAILYGMARSSDLWEKRISIVSTLYFITNKDFDDTLRICKILIEDKHDLIHKSCGWMLREVGKKDVHVLESFLDEFCTKMPRTTLRYSIERFDDKKRKRYLNMM